jgi:signal transduction histidine kinase
MLKHGLDATADAYRRSGHRGVTYCNRLAWLNGCTSGEKRFTCDQFEMGADASLRTSVPAPVTLKAGLPQSPLSVVSHVTQFHQVLTNLCSNALQALDGGGAPQVAVMPVDVASAPAMGSTFSIYLPLNVTLLQAQT